MEKERTVQTRSLRVSESVVYTVTKQTVMEIDGVHSLAPGRVSVKNFLLRSKPAEDSIKIVLSVDSAQISVSVNLLYGYKIKEIAERIQKNVKAAVQNMTGITVSKVNVHIAGVVKNETSL